MSSDGRPLLAPSISDEEVALEALPVDEASFATRQTLEILGSGPLGETVLALDFRRNRRVAVKALTRSPAPGAIEALLAGARIAPASSVSPSSRMNVASLSRRPILRQSSGIRDSKSFACCSPSGG